jgi:hypothetical protein
VSKLFITYNYIMISVLRYKTQYNQVVSATDPINLQWLSEIQSYVKGVQFQKNTT